MTSEQVFSYNGRVLENIMEALICVKDCEDRFRGKQFSDSILVDFSNLDNSVGSTLGGSNTM